MPGHRDDLRRADCVIVIAGMEGALPSVVAGLTPRPVVAVPTSVGYGASFQGIAALLGMLSSCSPGITVVNIDNGFGAAMAAHRIVGAGRRLAEAEAVIHRREVEQVAFHEVGAVDSIVDICGTALAFTMLGIERAFASPVPTGLGMVRTDHGSMPIPAPAVVELLRGAPI